MPAPTPSPRHPAPGRTLAVAVLVVAAGVLGVTVLRQRAEIRRLSRLVEAEREPPAVTIRTAPTRSLGVVTAPAVGRPPASRPTTDDAAAAGAGDRWPGRPGRTPGASPLARLLGDPEFFAALGLHREAMLDERFAGLFRRLGLGEAELAAFKRLLAEKDNVALDVVAVGESLPDGPLSPALLDAGIAAARARVEEAIRAALGSERYAVYRDYERTQPQRAVVAQLEQRLSYSATPLAPGQADALVQILAIHAPSAPVAEAGPVAAVVVGAGAPAALARLQTATAAAQLSETALTESQAVLTPVQLGALRQIQTEQRASLAALQLIGRTVPAAAAQNDALLRLLLQ